MSGAVADAAAALRRRLARGPACAARCSTFAMTHVAGTARGGAAQGAGPNTHGSRAGGGEGMVAVLRALRRGMPRCAIPLWWHILWPVQFMQTSNLCTLLH